jgi:hypothetical protein
MEDNKSQIGLTVRKCGHLDHRSQAVLAMAETNCHVYDQMKVPNIPSSRVRADWRKQAADDC